MKIREMPEALGIAAERADIKRMEIYHDEIMEMTKHINLTGFKDPEESLIKNVYDSLTVYDEERFPAGGRVLDLGTGGGFPGAILAALRPDMQFVLMDSIQKKLRCVETAAMRAGIQNISYLHMRAEVGGRRRKLRETFDVVTARAVKSLPILIEWVMPFVKEGGVFLAMKGPGAAEELAASQKILGIMESRFIGERRLTLPTGDERVILYIRKEGRTPHTFPRKAGVAEKLPILSEPTASE